MKSHIQLIPTHNMSNDEWLQYRYSGIGASETACVLGLNPYKSSIELFYEKIGLINRINIENISMFLGKEQESFIAELWEYWEGSPESMIANYRAGRKVRRCQRVNAYVRNPKYPHIFVSLDRKINKHEDKGEGALEIKTISGYAADKWEAGIPPYQIIQLQTQLMGCEFDYGELAVLKDGRDFFSYPFEPLLDVQETIAVETKKFWDDVIEARPLVNRMIEAERNMNLKLAEEIRAQIEEYEPAPDGSDAYKNYLSEKFKNPSLAERRGTPDELIWAEDQKDLATQIKQLSETKTKLENQLKNAIGNDNGLDFGASGKVLWKADKNGIRSFRNNVKS